MDLLPLINQFMLSILRMKCSEAIAGVASLAHGRDIIRRADEISVRVTTQEHGNACSLRATPIDAAHVPSRRDCITNMRY